MQWKRRKTYYFDRPLHGRENNALPADQPQELQYHKTQTVQIVNQSMIDTPGEYLERRYFRGALMVTAADADTIVLVQDATEKGSMFPPAYSSMFAKPAWGL